MFFVFSVDSSFSFLLALCSLLTVFAMQGDAMRRARILDFSLQQQLYPFMQAIVPLPSIYNESFVASNQAERADNVIEGSKEQQLEKIRQDIRDFQSNNHLDKVIVLWTATTERFTKVAKGIHDTSENILAAIKVSVSLS
jgi:myo-inositol-1-phosphate synthase